MAFRSGTATDYMNLLDIIDNELKNQNWVAERDQTRQKIYRGEGLSGQEEIYFGIEAYEYSSEDIYNIRFDGYTGYNSSGDFFGQPGSITDQFANTSLIALDNSDMDYWLSVNTQRIIIVVSHNGVNEHAYLGFFNTFGTPNQYPYPLFVGGSMSGQKADSTGDLTDIRYGESTAEHSAYWNPGNNSNGTVNTTRSSGALFRGPSGSWKNVVNFTNDGIDTDSDYRGVTWPYMGDEYSQAHIATERIRTNFDGSYTVYPVMVCGRNKDGGSGENIPSVYGELDNVYYVSGFGLTSQDVLTINGSDYIAFKNTFRNGINHFMCMEKV